MKFFPKRTSGNNPFKYSGRGWLIFCKKKSPKRLHCFDSFKSWVWVIVKWDKGVFFGNFLVEDCFLGGKLKKISKKTRLSLNYCSGHNFCPTECCIGQFSPQNTPSVYWILSIEICVVQHGVSIKHKAILVGTPHWSKKNGKKSIFVSKNAHPKNLILPPKPAYLWMALAATIFVLQSAVKACIGAFWMPDWMLVFNFLEKNNFPDFFKHYIGQFRTQKLPKRLLRKSGKCSFLKKN